LARVLQLVLKLVLQDVDEVVLSVRLSCQTWQN